MADPGRIGTRTEWTRALQGLFDRAGLSYHVLAERSGASASTLQLMVTGQSFPRASTVRLFVLACGERDAQPWVDARARVAAGDVTLRRPRTPPGRQVRIGAVPRAAGSFQDREAALALREAAEHDGTVVLTQVLAGMGGVGKTQLAAAHARQAWRDGAGLVMWVNAASRDAIVAAYADAATTLEMPGAGGEDPERSARAFLAWAETVTGSWWLVVLDDVQRPGDLNGLWPPAADSAAAGQVVVTTRLREAALAGAGHQTVEVTVYTPPEARGYLQAALGGQVPAQEADALAGALGMLPVALAQAAAYIRNADITIGRYLELLATRLLRDVVPEPGHFTDDHQRAVTLTWELSVRQADKTRPAGLARPLLELASVLDPAGIPQQALSSPPAAAYLAAALAATAKGPCPEVDDAMVDEALRVLHRYSLIDHDRTSRYREVRVHQLVQRATRENLTTRPGRQGPVHAAADALVAIWPPTDRDTELGGALRANAVSLADRPGQELWRHSIHPVLLRAGQSLGRAGLLSSAALYFTDLRDRAEQRLGADHPDTLTARSRLAHWQGESGQAELAATAFTQLLADRIRVLGKDHPDTLSTRQDVARWRAETGDVAGAISAFRAVLADRERLLGPDHRDTLFARNLLAWWRGYAGDAAGAVEAFRDVLADRVRVLGPDDPDTLTSRYDLAAWLGEAGDPAGAVAALQEVLGDYLRVLGPDHPHTLKTRNEMARWRGPAGDPAGAVAELEKVLADRLRVFGPDNRETLVTRFDLAAWRGGAGDPAGAVAGLQEVLADQLRLLGPSHRDTLITRNVLARWRGDAGDPSSAVTSLQELLADQLRLLGPDNHYTLTTRFDLAYWRARAGDPIGAVAELKSVLSDRLRILGPDHADTTATRNELEKWRDKPG